MMSRLLDFQIAAQPDEVSCGPTCLQSVYRYFGDQIALETLIAEVGMLGQGGTLDVFLANHALQRGYRATLYSYNLRLFDPTWYGLQTEEIVRRLEAQAAAKADAKLRLATQGYLRFLELGGRLLFEDLRPALLRRYLKAGKPIMTGLSSTYLYRDMRELPHTNADDDIRGEPVGHFVVLYGYDAKQRMIQVADPYQQNPLSTHLYYEVQMYRLIGAVLLGCLTYDANLLIIEK